MNTRDRFKIRRALLRNRGLCERCGCEKAISGRRYGILCASEKRLKKLVALPRRIICEKIARLERNKTFCIEALSAIEAELRKLG